MHYFTDIAVQSVGQNDHDIVPNQEKYAIVSPVFAYTTNQVQVALNQSSTDLSPAMYFSETSSENNSTFTGIPGLAEPLDAPKDSHLKSKLDSQDAEALIGPKRLMKTPKAERGGCIVEVDLGLKRLLKTPKTKKIDESEVESNIGLKRLMKTPKLPKQQCVEDNLGLKRLMKTPKESNVDSPESHCVVGLERLLKSPNAIEKEVKGSLGLERLMKTPKQKESEIVQVDKNLGLKRLLKTPKEKANEVPEIEGDLGLHKLMQSPKASIPSVTSPHLDALFYDMREKKIKGVEVKEKFGLARLMATSTEKHSKAPSTYSLDVGSLPALFALRKQEYQPVEDMQLQEMFIETDTCHTDNKVMEPEQPTQKSVNITSAIEKEPMIKVTRRGLRSVCKEAPGVRSTRVTRGKKTSIPVIDDIDVNEVGDEFNSESGASDPPKSPEDTKTGRRVTKREPKRKGMGINGCPEENIEQKENAVKILDKVSFETEQKRSTRGRVSQQPQEPIRQEIEAQPATKRRRTRADIRMQEDITKAEAATVRAKICLDTVMNDDCSPEKLEPVTNSDDSVLHAELPRRGSRRCREVAAKSTQRKATRSNKVDVPVHPVVLPTETSMEEDNVTEEIGDETVAPLRSRPRRKCHQQLAQGISGRKTRSVVREQANADTSQNDAERAVTMSGQKGRGRTRKVVNDPVDNAGLVKGMVKTPPALKFAKTVLQPIPEDKEAQIDSIVVEESSPSKASSRRSRRKLIAKEDKKDEPVAKKKSYEQDDISVASSKASNCQVSIEPHPGAGYHQTRSSQKPLNAGESQQMKRKRPTRSAGKQESTESENSTEENGSTEKRTRQVRSKAKPVERSTRKSARLRNC